MKSTTFFYKTIVTLLIVIMVVPTTFVMQIEKVEAQVANPLAVPTDCGLSLTCMQNNWKTFIGDRLAVMITNQIIQRMTASVVKWINTGFEGSPSFLTNPEGFFLDVADQITGEMIDRTGILSELCSPFSFDIRLNIALNQTNYAIKRYDCTLGKVIANTRNSIETIGQNSGITLYGDEDGATIGNFINGDFSQGGWGGFIAYTTEPQNNPIGAYLMAQSDLQAQIAKKQGEINTDLNRGQGFMSWPKCTDITSQYNVNTTGELSPGAMGLDSNSIRNLNQNGSASTGNNRFGNSTNIRRKVDPKTKEARYESCETQTPGSVIASSLFNQADTGREKLVSVKTISDSIDAITGALVNQMLTQGLAALSSRGSGTGGSSQSYLTQLYEESYDQSSFDAVSSRDRSLSTTNSIVELAQSNINSYNSILNTLKDTKDRYLSAGLCFVGKMDTLTNAARRSYGERMVGAIDMVVNMDIEPLIASTTEKRNATQNLLNQYQVTTAQSTNSTAGDYSRVENALNSSVQTTQTVLSDTTDIRERTEHVNTKVIDLNADAQTFMNICSRYPNISNTSNQFINPRLGAYR